MYPPAFIPLVSVVDFHHARGPEVEHWFGIEGDTDPVEEHDWHLLPFLALSDGSHSFSEEFSYFTLVRKSCPPQSLFGISCTRQIDSSTLSNKSKDVTRSSVQKAVVAILDNPQNISAVREKLSIVTKAWFAQRDFTDCELLKNFQWNLAKGIKDQEDESDNLFGLSLRELIHTYKWQTLVLFKCLLLQPKMLFFGSHCENICLTQFSLLSLIPDLLRALVDCADPSMDTYAARQTKSSSLRTSDRQSLLNYMGLPLQIFGKGSLFSPYTPLQHLDMLADHDTKSYLVGSTNALLLQQKDKYADVFVHVDEATVNILSSNLKTALTLSTPDRRWIDNLSKAVNDTWDEEDPSRPSDSGFVGSEEYIRLQFEEYLLSLLSSVKYSEYLRTNNKSIMIEIEGDPAEAYNPAFVTLWTQTENYKLFTRITDAQLFDVIEAKHPSAGSLTIDDVSRRLTQQVQDLQLDEKIKGGREALGKHLAVGRGKIGDFVGGVWADIETIRDRRKSENVRSASVVSPDTASSEHDDAVRSLSFQTPDLTNATAQVQAVGSKASAFLSSWSSWAAEKKKSAWAGYTNNDTNTTNLDNTVNEHSPSKDTAKKDVGDSMKKGTITDDESVVKDNQSRSDVYSNKNEKIER